MQKSREGLLRHILHSALLSIPPCTGGEDLESVKHICGERRLSSNAQRAWTYDELFEMLSRLTSSSHARFFFLIDALDECEPQDCLGGLADEVLRISQLPNVKLCVSCRPWSVFNQRFNEAQVLHLDQMTYRDMERYIQDRLASVGGDHELCLEFQASGQTERAAEFVKSIAWAANGVFLWVELVVKALASELRKGTCNDFGDLETVLDEFPIGLDEYFHDLIFNRITKTRRNVPDTAAALMLALKVAEFSSDLHVTYGLYGPLSFLNFWLLSRGYLGPDISWTSFEDMWYTAEDAERMVRQTRNFIEETCKDLLVVGANLDSGIGGNVNFLHRTVSDFLSDNQVRLIIEQKSPKHFKDESFLIDLGKLRCVCYFRHMSLKCDYADIAFQSILEWSRPSSLHDRKWLLFCETLMVKRYETTCNCAVHRTRLLGPRLYYCAGFGLIEYVLATVNKWPYLALNGNIFQFIRGWLAFAFQEPYEAMHDQLSPRGLRKITSSITAMKSVRDETFDLHGLLTGPLDAALASRLGNRHTRLLSRFFEFGIDPNQRGGDLGLKVEACYGSVWQTWLRIAYKRLESCAREGGDACSQRDGRSPVLTRDIKRAVSDAAIFLLRHGADPTCRTCISNHPLGEQTCRQVSLEDVLEIITPFDKVERVQTSRITHALHFNQCAQHHYQMLRAMRAWQASKREVYKRRGDDRFLSKTTIEGFVSNFFVRTRGRLCGACKNQNSSFVFATAACLQCASHHYLCPPVYGETAP